MMSPLLVRVAAGLAAGAVSLTAIQASAEELPPPAQQVDIDEQLGRRIDMSVALVDQEGRATRLGDSVSGKRPIVLVLAYYRCPMLCGLVLRGVAESVSQLGLSLGHDFDAATVSIDPRDTAERAKERRASVLRIMGRAADPGWPFMTGSELSARSIADQVGFRYAYDPRTDQYAHPAVTIILTPAGVVSRYLYGVAPTARGLRLALLEAGEGKTGGILDRVIMSCYRYDPAARAYGPYVLGLFRIGGGLALAAVVATVALSHRRGARNRSTGRE